jgi:hypothetical protein
MILYRGRKPKKEFLLEELAKENIQTLGLAYAYARNLMLYGVDITKVLDTAAQNAEALSRAYEKGYYDAMEHAMELEKKARDRDEID